MYNAKKNGTIKGLLILGIATILVLPVLYLKNVVLLVIVILTSLFLLFDDFGERATKFSLPIRLLGKASYSIFVFHQIILAFYRYYISQTISIGFFVIYMILLASLSFFGYRFIEKKIPVNNKSLFAIMAVAIPVCAASFLIYMNAGVVRDVPELCISKNNVHRNMHAEYVDRVYSYDRNFMDDDKIKVLCIGNSFARDWANVLMESSYADSLDISYSFECKESIKNRIAEADYVFVYLFKSSLPDWFWNSASDKRKVFGIGNKNFGSSNGIVYARRFSKDYYNTTITISKSFDEENQKRKSEWDEHYIDMLSYVKNADNSVRVFTDNHTFISQDCMHLTQEGAKYYASVIDFSKIFGDYRYGKEMQ